jgi:hypothetical protein
MYERFYAIDFPHRQAQPKTALASDCSVFHSGQKSTDFVNALNNCLQWQAIAQKSQLVKNNCAGKGFYPLPALHPLFISENHLQRALFGRVAKGLIRLLNVIQSESVSG